uniref:WxxW domain-containing protein n=1 Tax=Cyprinus carpio TaxID=7962 RepID=A0A8C1ILH7_CYPCA
MPSPTFSTGITSPLTKTSTVQNSSIITNIYTTPPTKTSSTTPSMTSLTSTTLRKSTLNPIPGCNCHWSDWNDFGGPTTGRKGGEIVSIERIIDTYHNICSVPKEVQCRAKHYPGVPLSQLGQVVKCNMKDGLVCLNKHQGLAQHCYDYEIRVFCCDENCGNITTQSSITSVTTMSSGSVHTPPSTTSMVKSPPTGKSISTTLTTISKATPSLSFSNGMTTPQTKTTTVHNSSNTTSMKTQSLLTTSTRMSTTSVHIPPTTTSKINSSSTMTSLSTGPLTTISTGTALPNISIRLPTPSTLISTSLISSSSILRTTATTSSTFSVTPSVSSTIRFTRQVTTPTVQNSTPGKSISTTPTKMSIGTRSPLFTTGMNTLSTKIPTVQNSSNTTSWTTQYLPTTATRMSSTSVHIPLTSTSRVHSFSNITSISTGTSATISTGTALPNISTSMPTASTMTSTSLISSSSILRTTATTLAKFSVTPSISSTIRFTRQVTTPAVQNSTPGKSISRTPTKMSIGTRSPLFSTGMNMQSTKTPTVQNSSNTTSMTTESLTTTATRMSSTSVHIPLTSTSRVHSFSTITSISSGTSTTISTGTSSPSFSPGMITPHRKSTSVQNSFNTTSMTTQSLTTTATRMSSTSVRIPLTTTLQHSSSSIASLITGSSAKFSTGMALPTISTNMSTASTTSSTSIASSTRKSLSTSTTTASTKMNATPSVSSTSAFSQEITKRTVQSSSTGKSIPTTPTLLFSTGMNAPLTKTPTVHNSSSNTNLTTQSLTTAATRMSSTSSTILPTSTIKVQNSSIITNIYTNSSNITSTGTPSPAYSITVPSAPTTHSTGFSSSTRISKSTTATISTKFSATPSIYSTRRFTQKVTSPSVQSFPTGKNISTTPTKIFTGTPSSSISPGITTTPPTTASILISSTSKNILGTTAKTSTLFSSITSVSSISRFTQVTTPTVQTSPTDKSISTTSTTISTGTPSPLFSTGMNISTTESTTFQNSSNTTCITTQSLTTAATRMSSISSTLLPSLTTIVQNSYTVTSIYTNPSKMTSTTTPSLTYLTRMPTALTTHTTVHSSSTSVSKSTIAAKTSTKVSVTPSVSSTSRFTQQITTPTVQTSPTGKSISITPTFSTGTPSLSFSPDITTPLTSTSRKLIYSTSKSILSSNITKWTATPSTSINTFTQQVTKATVQSSPTTKRVSTTLPAISTALPSTTFLAGISYNVTSMSPSPITSTSSTTPSITSPTFTTLKTTTYTHTPLCICRWSDWSGPTKGVKDGELIPISTFSTICSAIKEVECRAKLYPDVPLSQLGQVVECNVKHGLVCSNKNQDHAQQCFDYEIRVFCCDRNCGNFSTKPIPAASRMSSTSLAIRSTTMSTVQSSSSGTSMYTTPVTSLFLSTASTTSPLSKSATHTPNPTCICHWSEWLDLGGPTTGPEGGERISIKRILDKYPAVCSAPKKVECRAKNYPRLSLSQLNQVVKCNAKDGLVCLNKYQDITHQCFDYEIRVSCCDGNCGSSTAPTQRIPLLTPTLGCICQRSDWMDFGSPTIGLKGGEIISIKRITGTYPTICSAPKELECRAKLYPELSLSQLGQVVICNSKDGLMCLNKNQDITHQCFDYEIRVLCCHGQCSSSTQAATTSAMLSLSRTTTPSTASSGATTIQQIPPFKTSKPVTSTPECICHWSELLDFGGPTVGPEGGEKVTIKKITDTYPSLCSAPKKVECHAKHYPQHSLLQLGQVVICNAKDGLLCLNKNQDITQQCFDYNIRVLCCYGKCDNSTQTPTTPSRLSGLTTTTLSSIPSPTSTPSKTSKPSPLTPNPLCICQWSKWLNFGRPTTGPEGGKHIPVKFITDTYPTTCSIPQGIECRAKLYPRLPVSQLGQIVKCNLKDGLVCLNKKQNITQQCFDYEMRLLCCHRDCVSATLPAALTLALYNSSTSASTTTIPPKRDMTTSISKTSPSKCICQWSDWMDFGSPTTGPEGGKHIHAKFITDTYPTTCSIPQGIECRAKLYPRLPVSHLGQVVKCDLKDGLVCLNKKQNITQQCFDYEMRLLCCHRDCVSATLTAALTLALFNSSTSASTSTTTPTRAMTTTISKTSSKCICKWSDWMDFGSPTTGPEGGKHIPVKFITDTYPTTCSIPQGIECRAKLFPRLPVSQLGQVVKCNLKDGLVCLNKKQNITQQCFDYEMRLLCCHRDCVSATLPAALTLALYNSSTSVSTSTITPTRAMTTTILKTSPSKCICQWSDWIDFGSPTTGPEGGKHIHAKFITDTYPTTCSIPQGIECRAKLYPRLPVSQLGQVVKCNLKDGLVCLNKKQSITQQCFDYEIRLLCCHRDCVSATLPAALTIALLNSSTSVSTTTVPPTRAKTTTISKKSSECICLWSDWMDFGSPTTGPEGGEIIPINSITNTYFQISSAPTEVECHAKLYPGLPLSQLGQVVTCNSVDGLVCLNKNQGVTKQCFDYEIKILQCHGLCVKSSRITQSNFSNSTIITTRIITGSTGGHITANHDCVCEINGNTFKPESEIYNKTDGDGWCYTAKCVKIKDKKCDVITLSVPCLTTVLPTASMPLTGNCDKHMPPLKNGESINVGNCSIDTCINGTMERKAVHCDPVQYPVCKNNFPLLKVADKSGCCFKYECLEILGSQEHGAAF